MAGFSPPLGAQEVIETAIVEQKDEKARAASVGLFRQERPTQLAAHRSHSSHSSHSSHRSSSGGGGYYPSPLYSPPPPPPPPPLRRSVAPVPFFSVPSVVTPSDDGFVDIVKRVQTGLKAFGYYVGELDGQVGPETRGALTRLQTDFTLKITGTITPEVLKALSIEM